MNQYLVFVKGNDSIGFNFLKNVVEMANKGAKLQEGKVPTMRFPYSAWMTLETKEIMEDKPGIRFQIIVEKFTKEQLDEMEWEDFKRVLKRQYGLGGRNRDQMTKQYLKAAFDDENHSDEVEKDKE